MVSQEPARETRVAAIVPCYNEEISVATVVGDLKAAWPGIDVYVYDNASSDETSARAREAGAIVRQELRPGKGNVLRRAFADVDADVYVMVDGDDTYDVSELPEMIRLLQEGPYDHVLGVRQEVEASAYRRGHQLGNRGFNRLVGLIFGQDVSDMLSGYRVMSRRFVKSFPAVSREFEIETELTVHAMSVRSPQVEHPCRFQDRAPGSESKLRTYHDGFKILRLVVRLMRQERPLFFHGVIGTLLLLLALVLGVPLLLEYASTGLVPRFPTAILATGITIIGILSWTVGLVLDGVLTSRREFSRLTYLLHDAPG